MQWYWNNYLKTSSKRVLLLWQPPIDSLMVSYWPIPLINFRRRIWHIWSKKLHVQYSVVQSSVTLGGTVTTVLWRNCLGWSDTDQLQQSFLQPSVGKECQRMWPFCLTLSSICRPIQEWTTESELCALHCCVKGKNCVCVQGQGWLYWKKIYWNVCINQRGLTDVLREQHHTTELGKNEDWITQTFCVWHL